MNFVQRCTIAVARPQLWEFLMDVPRMAACVPGFEEVVSAGNDTFSGRMRVKLGPIVVNLEGTVAFRERDAAEFRAVVKTDARDCKIGGGVDATATMRLLESGPAASELVVEAQARFMGKLGEFGEPVIRKQTDATIAAFARNVAARFQVSAEPGQGPQVQ
jgi:uncharacterized protein